jgi:ABC-type arginine/histidine transport system permease subunit
MTPILNFICVNKGTPLLIQKCLINFLSGCMDFSIKHCDNFFLFMTPLFNAIFGYRDQIRK